MSTFLSDAAPTNMASQFVRGQSAAAQSLNSMVEEIARTHIPVLLMGESGTGKEVYGRMIHRLSKQAHVPLKKISCRAVQHGEFLALLKSELREVDSDGTQSPRTIFLDGIDELDLESQRALLSILP